MSAFRGVWQLLVVLSGAAVAPAALAQASPVPPAVEQAAKTYITRGSLEGTIRFLSSDALEGRGPATRGASRQREKRRSLQGAPGNRAS